MTNMQEKSIYVAGGGGEREVVAPFIPRLQAAGFTLTYDWLQAPGWSRQNTRKQDVAQAQTDFYAVLKASIFWLLVPDQKSEGSHFELGVARTLAYVARRLGMEPPRIIVSGPHYYRSHRIFPLLADEYYDTHEEAFEAVLRGEPPSYSNHGFPGLIAEEDQA